MRRVIFEKEQEDKEIIPIWVENFRTLLDTYEYIGFIPYNDRRHRYMIYRNHPMLGTAIRSKCCWNLKNKPIPDEGTYFIFKSERELYRWMAGVGDD
jgi:hypothetical protein